MNNEKSVELMRCSTRLFCIYIFSFSSLLYIQQRWMIFNCIWRSKRSDFLFLFRLYWCNASLYKHWLREIVNWCCHFIGILHFICFLRIWKWSICFEHVLIDQLSLKDFNSLKWRASYFSHREISKWTHCTCAHLASALWR